MSLSGDAIDLLCAAFLSKAGRGDDTFLLYVRKQSDISASFKRAFGVSLTDAEVTAVLDRLIEIGVFARAQDRFTNGFIHVVGRPVDKLQMLSRDKFTPYFFADAIGQEWLDAALQSSAFLSELSDPSLELVSALAPASDRLVTLDHNSGMVSDLVDKVEIADEAVRASNSVDPEVTGWVRIHIEAGLKLLTSKKVILSAVTALLLKPLLSAYDAVTEEPAKAAIMVAIQAVRTMFGI